MARKSKNKFGVIYSTDENYNYENEMENDIATLPPNKQKLYIRRDTKNRKGKEATLIEGFIGSNEDLNTLAKMLKTKCGVGGNVVDGEILIQGDKRNKVKELLEKEGYNCKLKGG